MLNLFGRKSKSQGPVEQQPTSAQPPAPANQPRETKKDTAIADIEHIDSVAVATITATELSQVNGAARLSDLLIELAESGIGHVVLDLQNVQFMDSVCVGCLVDSASRMRLRGGRIALVNPHSTVAHLFKLAKLDRVFPICRTVLGAIETLGKSPA